MHMHTYIRCEFVTCMRTYMYACVDTHIPQLHVHVHMEIGTLRGQSVASLACMHSCVHAFTNACMLAVVLHVCTCTTGVCIRAYEHIHAHAFGVRITHRSRTHNREGVTGGEVTGRQGKRPRPSCNVDTCLSMACAWVNGGHGVNGGPLNV